ncbi:hypothetical protein K435DRAFT_780111 [Dendrothele bispora CBS 962.96]|uniref:Uncharacterized protein n=1 Tax=Dendrothele bispora (strain CBS 962.96) TaxID=1314807 RepID=A0A4S8LU11_DENBC|nr:hypothetical protein K435DRAFT_780111 [Dendrothele bispora CBS 962.96]
MFKLLTTALLLVLSTNVVVAQRTDIGLNEPCDTFVGSLGTCAPGLKCCILNPDNGVCKPESFTGCIGD